jgi:phosphatidylglycerophosphatase C
MISPSAEDGRPVIAVFDFDGTLTHRDSLFPFLRMAVGTTRFVRRLFLLSPVLLAYALRLLPNWRAKEMVLAHFFAGWTEKRFCETARAFAVEVLPRQLNREAMSRLQWHQRQGHRVLIVSASLEAYLSIWARAMGVRDVSGTRLAVVNGKLTGRLAGANCYGSEKVRRLAEILGDWREYSIYAYGDSRGDRELLKVATHPYYRSFHREGCFC